MRRKSNKNFSIMGVDGVLQTTEELLNKYGTYNIQPTQNSENEFPAIGQNTPEKKKK